MPITLGLCIPKGKKSRIRFPERIQSLCDKADIFITDININGNLEKQGPFDILLHKALDYHNEYEADEANQKIAKLISYASKHKKMVVIDDFNWCFNLTNRKSMTELLKSCQFTLNGIKVFLPKTVDLSNSMMECEIENVVRENRMKFPVVSKPHSAYFDDGAHDMSIIFSLDDVTKLQQTCLIQEFCNHGGVLYKVFVVGSTYDICERPSIKDVSDMGSQDIIHFDSFCVSKTGHPFLKDLHLSDPNKRHWYNSNEKPNMLDHDVTKAIISRIHRCTGLFLFGFDILIEKKTGNYALIDINQFPSYAGTGDQSFPKHLVELLKSLS